MPAEPSTLADLWSADFAPHKRNVRAVLTVLDTLEDCPFDRPGRDRPKLASAAAVMDACPQVRLVIDGQAQRVQRFGGGFAAPKPYY